MESVLYSFLISCPAVFYEENGCPRKFLEQNRVVLLLQILVVHINILVCVPFFQNVHI